MKKIFITLTFLIIFLGMSCSGNSKMVDRLGVKCNKVPAWAKYLPKQSGKIYAVGFAMPDTFPERSLAAAKTSARLELSRTIQTKIDVDTEMVDSYMKQNGIDEDSKSRTTVIRNIIKEKATKIVNNSKVEEVFYDNCNLNQRGENSYYVLVSAPK